MTFRVGTDVGGTFTDLWAIADDGRQAVVKAPTSANIIDGILSVVELAAAEFHLSTTEFCGAIEHFGHGTTAGLNALLTGTTARTALVTTKGFGDTLEIGRLKRQLAGLTELEIGDYLNRGRLSPVVPRTLVFEVDERVDRDGQVLTPLSSEECDRLIARLESTGVKAVAVATLWSVANPVHERMLGELLAERLPSIFVTLSHIIAPSVGEYARMSTTATNAALGPVMSGYISSLAAALRSRGLQVSALVMTSEGGVTSTTAVSQEPVSVLMSGPAAGVVACREIGARMNLDNVITVDVGGTSFDVGMIVDGAPLVRPQLTLGGADIQRATIDVATIGAGGGSLAIVRAGALSVGPQSAGARPGPVCYGKGGTQPTATDADLVLGVLAEEGFGDGAMQLDLAAAEAAIEEHIARPLGMGVVQAAWGIRRILDSKMADLLRSVTIEKGHDPREFVLFAGGGQGPSHAWALCRELGISRYVVTAAATVQSAYGTGTSELKRTVESPHYLRIADPETISRDAASGLSEALEELAATVRETSLGADGAGGGEQVTLTAAVRYRGQAHHLDTVVDSIPESPEAVAALLGGFERSYETLFGAGAAFREAGFEILSLRVTVTRPVGAPIRPEPNDSVVEVGSRPVYFDDPTAPVECPVFTTRFPAPGQEVHGPCLVVFPGQTLVVPPGGSALSDDFGNFVVTLEGI